MVNRMDISWDRLMERRSSQGEADECDRSRGEEKTRRAYWSIWDPRNHTGQQNIENHAAGPLWACCFAQSSKLSVINNQTNQLWCLRLRLRLKPPAASIAFAKCVRTEIQCRLLPVLSEPRPAGSAAVLDVSSPRRSSWRSQGMSKITTGLKLTTDLDPNNE